jgi:beta-phosphoglucomutase
MIKAIIFDWDGIITDTEPVHMEAWLKVLGPMGISFDHEEYYRCYVGLSDGDFLDEVGRNHHREFTERDKGVAIERKAVESHRMLEEKIPLMPGVEELIPKLRTKYPLAICSGALKREIMFVLNALGWQDYFKPVVTQEDVRKGKPNPEGFLFVLKYFQQHHDWESPLEASECLVIEDSPHGIQAARAAGMPVVAITNSFPEEHLHGADKIVSSLADVVKLYVG